MKLVSIIIPVHNAASLLKETIDSAVNQTYPYKEVIVVDDGSSDNSFALATCYQSSQVKVVRQENSGAAVARNTGLRIAKGELIQFLDAGDLLSPDKIEKQALALEKAPNKLAVCNFIKFERSEELQTTDDPEQSKFIFTSNQPLDFLLNLWGANGTSNFIQTNCWLVPRTLIEKGGGWRAYRCPDDDGEFFTRMILASDGIIYVPGIYNYYRMAAGANQLSSNRNHKYLMNTLLTIDLKYAYLLQNGNHPGIKKAMAKQYLDFAVYQYPSQPLLAEIAFRRYKQTGIEAALPIIGGIFFEMIKNIFGWKTARWIRHYLREIK